MIFCNLGSGSKGNCTYLRNRQGAILIDQGFSLKSLHERLQMANLRAEDVAAIVVSHEHSDHIKGVSIFARRYRVPVYFSEETRRVINPFFIKNVAVRTFRAGEVFEIEDLTVKTFHIPHDAVDPVAFVISADDKKAAIITDLGSVTQSVLLQISDLDLILLEANHDIEMLINGPYPLATKQRIKSRVGHLSNEQSLDLFARLNCNGRLKHLVLGHLSEINNQPQLVHELFMSHPACQHLKIVIANQNCPTPVVEI